MVDLQDKRLAVFIEHDINTQDVEAHIPQLIFWLAKPVLMRHQWMAKEKSLDDGVIQLSLYFIQVITAFLDQFEDGSKGPLMTNVHALVAGVVDEFRVLFIDGVIGEMNVLLPQVVLVRLHVRFSGKSRKALFINV